MNKNASARKRGPARAAPKSAGPRGKIHPVVIYPFRQPSDYSDLKALYELIARLDKEKPDLVSIVTPPKFHFPMTMAALSRGIHVL